MLGLTGMPNEKHCLLMNGDLVDRGSWSVEVILTAFAFKCGCDDVRNRWKLTPEARFLGLYPKRMYINRGNHEAKDMNSSYGFEGEVKHKHGEQTYKVCVLVLV
jgi:serine/threonine-protein phosphatase 5